nr:MAG TPA: hypothetical protein [Caudoviricetes sp.]
MINHHNKAVRPTLISYIYCNRRQYRLLCFRSRLSFCINSQSLVIAHYGILLRKSH